VFYRRINGKNIEKLQQWNYNRKQQESYQENPVSKIKCILTEEKNVTKVKQHSPS
jgi:hypothetical protein